MIMTWFCSSPCQWCRLFIKPSREQWFYGSSLTTIPPDCCAVITKRANGPRILQSHRRISPWETDFRTIRIRDEPVDPRENAKIIIYFLITSHRKISSPYVLSFFRRSQSIGQSAVRWMSGGGNSAIMENKSIFTGLWPASCKWARKVKSTIICNSPRRAHTNTFPEETHPTLWFLDIFKKKEKRNQKPFESVFQ